MGLFGNFLFNPKTFLTLKYPVNQLKVSKTGKSCGKIRKKFDYFGKIPKSSYTKNEGFHIISFNLSPYSLRRLMFKTDYLVLAVGIREAPPKIA